MRGKIHLSVTYNFRVLVVKESHSAPLPLLASHCVSYRSMDLGYIAFQSKMTSAYVTSMIFLFKVHCSDMLFQVTATATFFAAYST